MIIEGMVNQKEPWSIEILPTLQPNVWLLGRKNIEGKKRKRTLEPNKCSVASPSILIVH